MIIDRGQIVANGTPAELKQRSEVAGAVTLRVGGVNGSALGQKLSQLPTARKMSVLQEGPSVVTARVFPQPNARDGELARGIYESAAREGWKIEELHTEEGRLDEVFRSITMPDTVQEERK